MGAKSRTASRCIAVAHAAILRAPHLACACASGPLPIHFCVALRIAVRSRLLAFDAQVNGIVPGYKGFVPGAIDKCGGSHFGGVKGVGADGLNTVGVSVDADGDFYGLEQKGHGRDHKETMTAGGVKSGYAGHLPGARDTWGMTHFDTINLGADGRLHGKSRFVNDMDATNNHPNQQKTYHDDVSRAMVDD